MSTKIIQVSLLLFTIFTNIALAIEATPSIQQTAFVDIKVGIELHKLEQSAANIDQSIALASQAIQEMAKNPNITAEQQQKIMNTFEHITLLSENLQTTFLAIPAVIKQSAPPVTSAIDNLFSNIQLTIIIVLVSLLLIITGALIAIYYWVLRPTSLMLLKTTAKVDNMVSALHTTATIVEKNTEQQLLILNANSSKK